ncbi:YolD-like family protein [Paenibacillus sp. NPDC056579]|uniref:YolD-like family protein n=1 Tax=Paenibacillus sp. NPDC056579 TaxID=3345871 RepID=UPI0036AD3E7C
MWESPRMKLPEHREQSVILYEQEDKLKRPEITEEEQQEMFGKLKVSKANAVEVCITVFNDFEIQQITGVVTGLDKYLVKMKINNDWQLFKFEGIIGVDIDGEGY